MAALHPQVVHFAIALLIVGVLFRVISLAGRPAFLAPAAFTLLLLGTVAAWVSVNSGTAAHGPVERVPGARPVVQEHEEWAFRTRNAFTAVMLLELIGLVLADPKRRIAYAVSGVVGLGGLYALYQTGEAGGTLVYSYAGGVGIRTGNPQDVDRLLLAGMYQKAMADRKAGQAESAAALLADVGRRFPGDMEVQLLAAESLLLDKKDAPAAIAAVQAIQPPPGNRMLKMRHAMLTADVLEVAGQKDGAIAVVQGLLTDFPDNPRVKQRLDKLKGVAQKP